MSLELNYFYGNEAEQYSFYRIPKTLFMDHRYKIVSMEAKMLYGLMLDRMGYTCDMPRIHRFSAALEKLDWPGTLFCFDFQEAAMRQICGPGVDIQCIDFEKFERVMQEYLAAPM